MVLYYLFPVCRHLCTHRSTSYKFQHDGASVHTSKKTKRWIKDNGLRMFHENKWPPHSPDLNIIEHVWPMLTNQLNARIFNSRDHLWHALKKAARAIPPQMIRGLYESLPARIAALNAAKGGSTRY